MPLSDQLPCAWKLHMFCLISSDLKKFIGSQKISSDLKKLPHFIWSQKIHRITKNFIGSQKNVSDSIDIVAIVDNIGNVDTIGNADIVEDVDIVNNIHIVGNAGIVQCPSVPQFLY